MPSTREERSPLWIAEEVFLSLIRPPRPLALSSGELDPDGKAGLGPGPVALDELREIMRTAATPAALKNRAWSLLVARSQRHGAAWTVGAVGVALPRLVNLGTALAGGDHNCRPELDTEILTGFLAALAEANPQRPSLFPVLLRGAHRAGIAWLRQRRGRDTPVSSGAFESAPPPPPWGHPDLVLAGAVKAGVITAAEAELIGITRLEDVSTNVMAARLGITLIAFYARRERAEKRLVAALRQARLNETADATDPTFTTVLAARPMAARRLTCREIAKFRPSYPQRDLQARAATPPPPRRADNQESRAA